MYNNYLDDIISSLLLSFYMFVYILYNFKYVLWFCFFCILKIKYVYIKNNNKDDIEIIMN